MGDDAASAGQGWPPRLPVLQLRVARRVTRLEALVEFYHHGVGLPVIFQYQGHHGYDGVIFGLPGRAYNLELVRHDGARSGPDPDPDDLLVLYLAGQAARDAAVGRLAAPDDIARACVFLATNDFATGGILRVDGGEGLARAET